MTNDETRMSKHVRARCLAEPAETILGANDSYGEYQAQTSIGRGRVVNPRYRFHVQKDGNEHPVVAVDFKCDIEDLYDFNYEDGVLASHAAAHQIGYGKGSNARSSGIIYRVKVIIDHTYEDPFEQSIGF